MKSWTPWLATLICGLAAVIAVVATGPLQFAAQVVIALVMLIPIAIIGRAVYRRFRP